MVSDTWLASNEYILTVKLVDKFCVGVYFLYSRVQSIKGDIETLLDSVMVGAPKFASYLNQVSTKRKLEKKFDSRRNPSLIVSH